LSPRVRLAETVRETLAERKERPGGWPRGARRLP
jgi:hypothetical protein